MTSSPEYMLVGLFDILGYSSLIEQNPLSDVIDLIRGNMSRLPVMPQYIAALSSILNNRRIVDKRDNDALKAEDGFVTLVFSDTIVLLKRASRADPEFRETSGTHQFLRACGGLMREMFNVGLPTRGALAAGEVFHESPFLAGLPIVEANNFEKRQKWSGCIPGPSFLDHIGRLRNPNFLVDQLTRFKVPGFQGENLALAWPYYRWNELDRIEEPAAAVHAAFKAHGKSVDGSDVGRKLAATIAFVEHCNNLNKVSKNDKGTLQSITSNLDTPRWWAQADALVFD